MHHTFLTSFASIAAPRGVQFRTPTRRTRWKSKAVVCAKVGPRGEVRKENQETVAKRTAAQPKQTCPSSFKRKSLSKKRAQPCRRDLRTLPPCARRLPMNRRHRILRCPNASASRYDRAHNAVARVQSASCKLSIMKNSKCWRRLASIL